METLKKNHQGRNIIIILHKRLNTGTGGELTIRRLRSTAGEDIIILCGERSRGDRGPPIQQRALWRYRVACKRLQGTAGPARPGERACHLSRAPYLRRAAVSKYPVTAQLAAAAAATHKRTYIVVE